MYIYLDYHFKPILENVDPVLQVMFFLVVTCQVLLGVSHHGYSFLLQMVQYIIHLTLVRIYPKEMKNFLVASQQMSACLSLPKPIWTPLDSLSVKSTQIIYDWVDWSGVESTGQSSPVRVHSMDFYHYKILLEWTAVHWT